MQMLDVLSVVFQELVVGSSAIQRSCVFPVAVSTVATQPVVSASTADTVKLTNRTNQYTLTLLHVLLQELVVGSRARRRVKGLVSSPVAAPRAATQPLVSA